MSDNIFTALGHTKRLYELLFIACLRAAGQPLESDKLMVNRLPSAFHGEMRELFRDYCDEQTSCLYKMHMMKGLTSMAEAYIGGRNRSPNINNLRNCIFRLKLSELSKSPLTTDDKLRLNHDRDQRQQSLDSFDEERKAESSNDVADVVNSIQPYDGDKNLRNVPPLLRSNTTSAAEVSGEGRSALKDHLDNTSIDMLRRAMLQRPQDEQTTLTQLATLVASELKVLPEVQVEANMYIQRKIKAAIDAVRIATTDAQPLSINEAIIYTTDTCRSVPGFITRVHSHSLYDVQLEDGSALTRITIRDLERKSSGGSRLEVTRYPDRAAEMGQEAVRPLSAPTPSRLHDDSASWEENYIRSEAALLPHLHYILLPDHVPAMWGTKSYQEYNLWFKLDGKNKTEFHFFQQDIGLSYRPLLEKCGVPEDALDDHPAVLKEMNRCFFLHLGMATRLNPFVLQACFRRAARRLLQDTSVALAAAVAEAEAHPGNKEMEERATELALSAPDYLFEPVLKRSEYVDFDVLSFLWPVELAGFRICLVPIQYDGSLDTIICYTPGNSDNLVDGMWNGEDVIIKKESNHFTVLAKSSKPEHNYGDESLITRFLLFMERFGKPVVHREATVNESVTLAALTRP